MDSTPEFSSAADRSAADSTAADTSPAGTSPAGVGRHEVADPVQVDTDPTHPTDPASASRRGRVRESMGERVLPAVRGAGVRLAPVVTSAAGRAGDAARTAGGRVATRAEPVAREAARRGGNALLVIRGADLITPPAATPEPVRSRRGGRLAQRVAMVGALTGVSVAVWRALTTRTTPATSDTPTSPETQTSTAGTGNAPHAVDRPAPVAREPGLPEAGLTEATALTRPMDSPTAGTATIPLIGVDPTVGPVPGTAGPVPGAPEPVPGAGPAGQDGAPAAAS